MLNCVSKMNRNYVKFLRKIFILYLYSYICRIKSFYVTYNILYFIYSILLQTYSIC